MAGPTGSLTGLSLGAMRIRFARAIQAHWDAGADQVCIQSVPRDGHPLARQDERVFELLAPKNS